MTFRGIAKAAVVTLTLGVGGIAGAAPVQAFDFSMGFGDNNDSRFQICLTEFQLRASIENRGYTDVRLNVELNNRIHIRATRDGTIYQLLVNACTGRVIEREKLRPA